MFEPLPSLVRQRREQNNLTQEQLAKMAGVSRVHLISFEKGAQNVSLKFVLKIARALGMTELPIAELHFRPAVPELTVLLAAAEALAAAERIVASAAAGVGEISQASQTIAALVHRALDESRAGQTGLVAAAERLAKSAAVNDALREVAERPDAVPRRRPRSAAADTRTTTRRRAR